MRCRSGGPDAPVRYSSGQSCVVPMTGLKRFPSVAPQATSAASKGRHSAQGSFAGCRMSARGLKQNSTEPTSSAPSTDPGTTAALIASGLQSSIDSAGSSDSGLGPIEAAPISGKWLSFVSGANPVHVTDESGASQTRPSTKALRDKELELLSPELLRLFKEP